MHGILEVNGFPVRAVLSIASSGLTSWKLPTLPIAAILSSGKVFASLT